MVESATARVRRQGRPRQSDSEIGRDKLVERARKVMSRPPRTDVQRREIADVIGVTPALITYYFSDKWSLLEAAAHPIIAEHVAAIGRLLESPLPATMKFQSLVEIYINFNRENGYILDYYINASKKLEKHANLDSIEACHARVIVFIRDHMPGGLVEGADAEVVHSMLLSVCECLGRLPKPRHDDTPSRADSFDRRGKHQALVSHMFLRGLLASSISPEGSGPPGRRGDDLPVAGRGRPRQPHVPDQVSVAAETILEGMTGRSVT